MLAGYRDFLERNVLSWRSLVLVTTRLRGQNHLEGKVELRLGRWSLGYRGWTTIRNYHGDNQD